MIEDQSKNYKKTFKNSEITALEKLDSSAVSHAELQLYIDHCSQFKRKIHSSHLTKYLAYLKDENKYEDIIDILTVNNLSHKFPKEILEALFIVGAISEYKKNYKKTLLTLIDEKKYNLYSDIRFNSSLYSFEDTLLTKLDLVYAVELYDFVRLQKTLTKIIDDFRHRKISENELSDFRDLVNVDEHIAILRKSYLRLSLLSNQSKNYEYLIEYHLMANEKDEFVDLVYIRNLFDFDKHDVIINKIELSEKDFYGRYSFLKKDLRKKVKVSFFENEIVEDKRSLIRFEKEEYIIESKKEIDELYEMSNEEQILLNYFEHKEYCQDSIVELAIGFFQMRYYNLALKLSKKEESNRRLFYIMIECLYKLQKYSILIEKINDYKEKEDISLNYFLALAHKKLGNKKEAIKYTKKVIAEDPLFRDIRRKI